MAAGYDIYGTIGKRFMGHLAYCGGIFNMDAKP
jgi:hypothetical protein